MDKAVRYFYHFGLLIGVGWLVIAASQIFIGLQGQATTNLDGWSTYTWLGVAMFVLGVLWLVLWYFQYHYQRRSIG
jgi:Flp pilus assembly protein TadB